MHEMKKGIPKAFWEMHNEKFLFRVTVCSCQSQNYAYLKMGDQRIYWIGRQSILSKPKQLLKSILEIEQNISDVEAERTHHISFCTYIFVHLERVKVLAKQQMQMHWAEKVVHHVAAYGKLLHQPSAVSYNVVCARTICCLLLYYKLLSSKICY